MTVDGALLRLAIDRARRQRLGLPLYDPYIHGLDTTYRHHRCRCDECRKAANEARNQRRRRDPETIEHYRAYDRARRAKWSAMKARG